MKYLLPLLAVAAIAAAPAPKPQPWIQGWERPADPLGDCRFDRDGETMTITIPGKGHDFEVPNKRLHAPHLLRKVEGDFTVQVRIHGTFAEKMEQGDQRAGLLLTDGKFFFLVQFSANGVPEDRRDNFNRHFSTFGVKEGWNAFAPGPPALDKPVYLRVKRIGNRIAPNWSLDGKTWSRNEETYGFDHLPRTLKVGVIAEATADRYFKVTLDEFKLTPQQK